MPKKTPVAKPDPTPEVANTELTRDENGYGCLPQFENFHLPEEGFAQGAVVNGNEIRVVTLIDDKAASKVATGWVEGDSNISEWKPSQQDGDGWILAMVCDHEQGPFAVWARPSKAKELTGKEYAQEFLLGAMIKAATKHLKTLAKPWGELKESEQHRVLGYVHDDCRAAVRDAIDIIASNARLSFKAHVAAVTFKDGVKATLELAKTPEAHSLADAEGSYVTVVIEECSKLLNEGDALEADPDQKPLFDASTGDATVDTKEKDPVEA